MLPDHRRKIQTKEKDSAQIINLSYHGRQALIQKAKDYLSHGKRKIGLKKGE